MLDSIIVGYVAISLIWIVISFIEYAWKRAVVETAKKQVEIMTPEATFEYLNTLDIPSLEDCFKSFDELAASCVVLDGTIDGGDELNIIDDAVKDKGGKAAYAAKGSDNFKTLTIPVEVGLVESEKEKDLLDWEVLLAEAKEVGVKSLHLYKKPESLVKAILKAKGLKQG